jgi:GT2 family glycosyltransferase
LGKTAVVILCYNNRHFLTQFLPGVLEHSAPAEVIIIDNASTDGTADYLSNYFPQVRLIPHEQNLGFCGGYNEGLKQIEAEYFVLLNSDVEVTPGWLQPLTKLLNKNPEIAACQPKIRSHAAPEFFEYAGAGGGFIDRLGYPYCRGRIFDTLEQDTGQYDDTRPVFWATGACLMVRAELFREMGGLETSFFAHMEEIDLCWRIQRAGHQIYYSGESTVYHVGGGTLQTNSPRKVYLNFRNGLALLTRNLKGRERTWVLMIRILLDWVAALQFLAKGEKENAQAVLKAHRAVWNKEVNRNYIPVGELVAKSRAIQKRLPFSVVWQYFVRGRKTYPEL